MNLSEMQDERIALERSITTLVRDFEEETGLLITEIQISRLHNILPLKQMMKEAVAAKVVVIL